MYTLAIENTRAAGSENTLVNYIDNIMLVPEDYMLSADGQTLTAFFTSTRTFSLTAGAEHANRNYWMWMGCTGTYPGLSVSGVSVPLNYDVVVELGLIYPGFIHPDFLGILDASGNATVAMDTKPDASLQGMTFYFSYVVLSPGYSLPVLAASNHVNCTVTLFY